LTPSGVAPKGRHFHTAVVHDGCIWIFGGKSNGYMNDLFCLNLSIFFDFFTISFILRVLIFVVLYSMKKRKYVVGTSGVFWRKTSIETLWTHCRRSQQVHVYLWWLR
jgi:hypothetical protein